jgi:glycosyltransferase involved in cell wall biosynthesis
VSRDAAAPRFSIVTPSYGQGRFVGDALQSVRCQDHAGRVEHVVMDGGSTDGTVELLRRADGVRWVSEKDKGQSDALNKGFAVAEGEIIGWLNADDFYLEGALEAVARAFAENPQADVVYGDCVFVDSVGAAVRSKNEHGFDRTVLTYFGCYIPTTAAFFRHQLIDQGLLRLEPEFHYVMDYELFMRLAAAGVYFHYLPEELAAFRWHDENKSLDAAKRRAERRAVQDLFRVRPTSSAGRSVAEFAARGLHIARKAAEGSLGRQQAWKRRVGDDLHWWDRGTS